MVFTEREAEEELRELLTCHRPEAFPGKPVSPSLGNHVYVVRKHKPPAPRIPMVPMHRR